MARMIDVMCDYSFLRIFRIEISFSLSVWFVVFAYLFLSAGHERRMRDPNAKLNWYDKIGMQYGPGGWSPLEDIFIGGPENSREWFCGCETKH